MKIKLVLLAASSLCIAILFSSCTEEIEINLNDSDPQIVIEGSVPSNGDPVIVKVTESINFSETNDFPMIEGATITVSGSNGTLEVLSEVSPGIYTSTSLSGVEGVTYYLTFEHEESILSSYATIPSKIPFDSLIVEEVEGGGGFGGGMGGGGTVFDVVVCYTDPPDQDNYYRFVEYINGEFVADHIFDDQLTSGTDVKTSLFSFNRNLNEGDTLIVEMQCVDKAIYDYFSSFGNLSRGLTAGSTPANPYTNIEGSKLGYFNAHTRETRTFIVPE
jgi:hypothetical protein